MDTSPDSDGDDIAPRLRAEPSSWQPPWANGVTRDENQQTSAAPEYDNREFQQTHAAAAARHRAGAGGVEPLQLSSERTTVTRWHRWGQVYPDASGEASRSAGQSKQRAGARTRGSRRSAAAASAELHALRRMQPASARRAAKVSAERQRGALVAQLASSSSRCAGPQATILRHPDIVAHAVAHSAHTHTAAHSYLSYPGTAHRVSILPFDSCWFISHVMGEVFQLGPAGFAQLAFAVESAGEAARPLVVREPTRPAAKCAAPPPPMLPPNKQPPRRSSRQSRLAPSMIAPSPPSPPPSPPSSTSPPDAKRQGPWTPEENAELITWLFSV
jgi:hypothetical protein